MALALWSGGALSATAEPSDTDFDLNRLRFGSGAFVIESANFSRPGEFRVVSLAQFLQQPVVYFHESDFEGAVVGQRIAVAAGVEVGVTKWFSLGFAVPTALNIGSDATEFANDGLFLGDMSLSARFSILSNPTLSIVAHGEAIVPTGAPRSWTSEGEIRGIPGLLFDLRGGRFVVGVDLAAHFRTDEATGVGWTRGDELLAGTQVRYAILPERLDLAYGVISRVGLAAPQQLANQGVETMVGLQAYTGPVELTLGGGLGFGLGLGIPDYRITAGVGYDFRPRPRAQPAIFQVDTTGLRDAPDNPPPVPSAASGPPAPWVEGELVRAGDKEIAIRKPIQFEQASEVILPESLVVLKAVAELLITDGELAHIVIQGHASDEGSFTYNYDLSGRRARAVWEFLVSCGVHPDRLSFQGMGEVEPVRAAEQLTDAASQRRVVFRIIRRYQPGEKIDPLPQNIVYPWNGEAGKTSTPPPPPPKPEDEE